MRIDPVTGRVAHGNAGAAVAIDNQAVPGVPPRSGMPDWWGGRIVYCGDDSRALVSCAPDGSASVHVADGPTAVLLDMAPDGALVVGDYYHEEQGTGLSVYMPGASQPVRRVADARPRLTFPYSQAAALGVDTVVWTEDGGRTLRHVDGSRHALPWIALHPTLVRAAGALWVCYVRSADDAIIVSPWFDLTRGVVVTPGHGQTFGPAACVVDGRVVVRWATSEGELPGQLRSEAVDLSAIGPIPAIVPAPTPTPVPIPPAPPTPAPEPLAITITQFTYTGLAPLTVRADVQVTGHRGPAEVMLTIDGAIVAGVSLDAQTGYLTYELTEPGEYRLGAIVTSLGRTAQTGAVRLVRVLPPPTPVPPPPAPIKTGRDGYTQAGEEARAELDKSGDTE